MGELLSLLTDNEFCFHYYIERTLSTELLKLAQEITCFQTLLHKGIFADEKIMNTKLTSKYCKVMSSKIRSLLEKLRVKCNVIKIYNLLHAVLLDIWAFNSTTISKRIIINNSLNQIYKLHCINHIWFAWEERTVSVCLSDNGNMHSWYMNVHGLNRLGCFRWMKEELRQIYWTESLHNFVALEYNATNHLK